jgi:hypothetical protein
LKEVAGRVGDAVEQIENIISGLEGRVKKLEM